jgi:hypothetical protein
MITSATEFIRLRTSEVQEEYQRAAHEAAPLEVWWELVRDYPERRFWVVHNKTVPLEILEAMSTDDDTAVRDMVARKRKAPFEILEHLAQDPDSGVRYAVACNTSTPPAILEKMLSDEWETVVERAKERLREVK